MKKFAILFTLMAFISLGAMSQSISTSPGWKTDTVTPTIEINKNEEVVVTVNNPNPDVEHYLIIPGTPPTIVEKVKSNAKGESFSFKPIKVTKDGTFNYSITASDLSISMSLNITSGDESKKQVK